MTIADTDILLRLSGGAANTLPTASLGGIMSTTTSVVDNTAENLFDHVTGPQSTVGRTEYRMIYVLNNHGTIPYQNAIIWLDSETVHTGANIKIALDLAGANTTGDTIATEDEAPSPALTFVEASTEGAALSLGTLNAGQRYAVWFQRIIGAGTLAKNNYTTVIKVKGSSAEA